MSDNSNKLQGRKVKVIYPYKATMTDELNLRLNDVIVVTQCSEDETWLEGTLAGLTGWFPSNYVQLIEEDEVKSENNDIKDINQTENAASSSVASSSMSKLVKQQSDENLRIKYINELKRTEEGFLDEMCKFVKIALIPLQSNGAEIFPQNFIQQLNNSIDEVIRCHQIFYQKLKEIPENSDAKIGHLLITIATQFKHVYESYAKSNPKYTNTINKKRKNLSKFFESSLNKMVSPLLPVSSNMTVAIYITKFLAAPFKQLEIYTKLLREIYRYTEDYHVDRGDVQRCIEFYTDLSINVHEMRKRKEYELDIMSSRITNADEEFLQNNECLFLSSVLIITENGDKKERILLLYSSCILILNTSQSSSNEFDLEYKIKFLNSNTSSLIQLKRVVNLEQLNSSYNSILLQSAAAINTKHSFELLGVLLPGYQNSTRLLISCSSSYDFKILVDFISNILSKMQFALNNKSLKLQNSSTLSPPSNKQQVISNESPLSNNKSSTLPTSAAVNSNSPSLSHQQSFTKCTSPISVNKTSKKVFSMRPHPPLIPHFQLPNDSGNSNQINDGNSTIRRFMYKKAKLTEPFGKYHGADDDLKLLNVIESFCKTKIRQSSLNVNASNEQSISVPNLPNKVNLQSLTNLTSSPNSENNNNNENNKHINKQVTRLTEEKTRLEANVQSISGELSETKKILKEQKITISNLQKQLDLERQSRRKLEVFIRKHLKPNDNPNMNPNLNVNNIISNGTDMSSNILMLNVEHESSI